ncbi:MAG: His-Xaa-Ser system radical SAM maturase HxsC [Nitrospirae bacterium]|nr:His-Xaa-Ser system radical SAM maturase HxsC [Nitrospirota bacterium]
MKTIKGIPKNIDESIVGRITKKPLRRFSRRNSILITNSLQDKFNKYPAVISNDNYSESYLKRNKSVPLCHSVAEIDYLNDGDIVLIENNGNINVLYEKESSTNALMLTEKCNCDCIMCPQERKTKEENRAPLNLKIISLMDKSTKHLGLTGGEPTLIGNDLLKIIKACKKAIPTAQIDILTNGIRLCDFDFVKKIVLLQHPNLIFAIPLYADTDNEHDHIIKARGFHKTVQGIYNLALFNQRIEIRVVLHKLTYQRLPKLAEFIYHNFPFVFHITFMGMETRCLAEKNIEELWIDPHDYMSELKDAVIYLNQRLMNVSIYNLQLCVMPEELWPFSAKAISGWKNIYLDDCSSCDFKADCGGFFEPSEDRHSSYLSPIKKRLDKPFQECY